MANLGQHIFAFFSPHVAVNEDGDLVHANGLFDSGSSSKDLLTQEQSDYISDNWGGASLFHDPFEDLSPSSSDQIADDVPYYNEVLDKVESAAKAQNESAQNSADRAMEFSAEQAQLNRDFQEAQAQKAMDYQTQMSNTAYQRAMADMKAAGLNPKLAGKLGAASTPSGIAASGSSAQGVTASMSMANIGALTGLLETYMTNANSLDRQNNGFVQDLITSILNAAVYGKMAGIY